MDLLWSGLGYGQQDLSASVQMWFHTGNTSTGSVFYCSLTRSQLPAGLLLICLYFILCAVPFPRSLTMLCGFSVLVKCNGAFLQQTFPEQLNKGTEMGWALCIRLASVCFKLTGL